MLRCRASRRLRRAKLWSNYSESELKLLLRFANEGYKAVLEATEALKTIIDEPADRRAGPKKGSKTPR